MLNETDFVVCYLLSCYFVRNHSELIDVQCVFSLCSDESVANIRKFCHFTETALNCVQVRLSRKAFEVCVRKLSFWIKTTQSPPTTTAGTLALFPHQTTPTNPPPHHVFIQFSCFKNTNKRGQRVSRCPVGGKRTKFSKRSHQPLKKSHIHSGHSAQFSPHLRLK